MSMAYKQSMSPGAIILVLCHVPPVIAAGMACAIAPCVPKPSEAITLIMQKESNTEPFSVYASLRSHMSVIVF